MERLSGRRIVGTEVRIVDERREPAPLEATVVA